ncbi:MAG: Na+/H+ antiporter subunit E [Spirochaetales bacterium]|nr:Na+/H+ antiporter subunit E [Spirochaetales bacterium]
MRVVKLFIISLVIWFLIAWPYDINNNTFDWQIFIAGIIVSLFAGIFFRDTISIPAKKIFSIKRIFWIIVYIPVLFFHMLRANLDVLYRVIHPMMPIHPGIVKVKTKLSSEAGRTALANSITLTPGTLTVDITDDGFLYVHWIYIKDPEIEEATVKIVKHFEIFLEKIFD